jgi:hypothetical protein
MSDTEDECSHMDASTPELDEMRTRGYSIVRGVVDPDVIDQLKIAVKEHFLVGGRMGYGGKFQLRGLHVVPEVASVLLSEPIADVLRRHCSSGVVLLTGECDLMMNTTSGWHKDITPDMKFGPILFEDREFGVYKLAIYLQDQQETSPAAFRVRPGSQFRGDGRDMPEVRLDTRAGDVVVFDVRLDHAGQPANLRERLLHRWVNLIAPPLGADAEVWFTRLRIFLARLAGERPDRLAIFLTFGPDAALTHAYENAGRHRHGRAPEPLTPQAAAALSRLGFGMIDHATT